jgi:hypothetical protein
MILSCGWGTGEQTRLRTLSRVHVGIISTRRFEEECHLLQRSYSNQTRHFNDPKGTDLFPEN